RRAAGRHARGRPAADGRVGAGSRRAAAGPLRQRRDPAQPAAVVGVGHGAVCLTPDVSISLVNTNSRELLLACLESLVGVDAEIVVLDNASEDGSADAVRQRYPDVRVIE